jgi:YHS domain-containing protein
MAALAESFPNARADRNAHRDRSVWWFGYSERFPVTARLEIGLTHNETMEQLQLRYQLDIRPSFFNYDAHDKFAVPLETVDDTVVGDWVERKLFEFLGSYLAIDRGRDDADDESVTDPVCGMRIRRSAAVASSECKGHPYFFCSAACQCRFDAAPEQYVTVRI